MTPGSRRSQMYSNHFSSVLGLATVIETDAPKFSLFSSPSLLLPPFLPIPLLLQWFAVLNFQSCQLTYWKRRSSLRTSAGSEIMKRASPVLLWPRPPCSRFMIPRKVTECTFGSILWTFRPGVFGLSGFRCRTLLVEYSTHVQHDTCSQMLLQNTLFWKPSEMA